jgi:hypothetical protein
MKTIVHSMLAVAALATTAMFSLPASLAQVPAGAPTGTTGLCNDGSYWTGASKSGACRGHKGIKTWYAAAAASPAPAAKPAASPAPAAPAASAPAATAGPAMAMTAKPKASTAAGAKTAAPGGGPGMVWLNTSTKVYHCYGTKYYGTTKAGAYMSEADAKGKGGKADAGKPCS